MRGLFNGSLTFQSGSSRTGGPEKAGSDEDFWKEVEMSEPPGAAGASNLDAIDVG